MRALSRRLGAVLAVLFWTCAAGGEEAVRVGVATVDITPDYPVRLNGFGNRRSESEGVRQRVYAKALALVHGEKPAAVLITVDNLGVPDYMTREVGRRLKEKLSLDPARLAITSSHTHTAPMLKDCCPTIFGTPIPADHQERIERYTRELTDWLEQVAVAALKDLRPGRLEYGIGTAGFAINRRTPGGPVDHDLPVMVVRDPDGKARAIYVSYACHCVTLSDNRISGDWAGYVQELVERKYPGVTALTSVGCGADSNPNTGVAGDRAELAAAQGAEIAKEVERLLGEALAPLDQPLSTSVERIELLFDTHPTRAEWEERAKLQDATGHHARVQLARLDRGEALQTHISYPIQTWVFGEQLAMVFLPGEVVVDYSLRLKREFDRGRLWVNAYANDVPCYIPSERILKEGGYEGVGAMIYYDRPTRLAAGLEQKIIDVVHRQVPKGYVAPPGTEGVAPRSPEASLRSIRTKAGLRAELVASEPLVQSPVAIDWGADGTLWVAEMYDYPTGADGNWRPGGRVKALRDTDGDGTYDKAVTFLDGIPFPTGVTAWGRGVFVCAAPDILYAEDTDGDGKADRVEKRFSGFATDNYQARVNSLALGLDNWIYGANGLLGGTISSAAGETVEIRNRDFRFRPPGGPMETVTGLTQQGRARDDFGRWFGCDNGRALLHYPHEERYLRRNPHVPLADPIVAVGLAHGDGGRVFPASRALERFNDPNHVNRFTSACGVGMSRDPLLGQEYYGDAFTAEPVHNLVHRMRLSVDEEGRVTRRRAVDEGETEFLASTDNWFRPVQVRTGPDGGLYVVDMYRFLIEHPRWIPAERLAKLDVRAGAEMGRIYRVRPAKGELRAVRDLTKLSAGELAAGLDTPNGTERDRVHVELLRRKDAGAMAVLEKVAGEAKLEQVRLQALCVLDGMGGLRPGRVVASLRDPSPQVRVHAVRLCERIKLDGGGLDALLALTGDPSAAVRRQLALTLGEVADARAGAALARLAKDSLESAEMRAAVLSSAVRHCGAVLGGVMSSDVAGEVRAGWVAPLVATAAASDEAGLLAAAVKAVLPDKGRSPAGDHFGALASLLDSLERKGARLSVDEDRVRRVVAAARGVAGDAGAGDAERAAAVRLIGRAGAPGGDVELLCRVFGSGGGEALQGAVLAALRRQQSPEVAGHLLAIWPRVSPAGRAQIADLLLSRDVWSMALLEAVKARRVGANEISLGDRRRLAESADAEVAAVATELFPAQPESTRTALLEQYRNVASLSGNPAAGAELFEKNCAGCHVLGGVGYPAGPDLANLRGKDVEYLVKNILDPNAVVEPRFVNYLVRLNDGRLVTGVVTAETATSLTLAGGNGVAETVARSDVKSIRASGASMMPEGLEGALPPQQMADLVAFLKTTAPRREFAGNAPALITAGEDGSLLLPAARAEIFGAAIQFEQEFRNIGYWSEPADFAAWAIRVDKGGEFDVYFDFACQEASAGNRYVLAVGERSIAGVVPPTGADWSRYRQQKIGRLALLAGEQRLTVRSAGELRGAMIDLRTIALAPPGTEPKWPTAQAPPGADELARDPGSLARLILDSGRSAAAREAAINANPQFAPELIVEMTRDLTPGTPVEYERIPWIWRVAIAAGRRNDPGQLKRLLGVSLPQPDRPLHDWQAVVIGGGVINGISLQGVWPRPRLGEVIGEDEALRRRWERALELAAAMTDDQKVPTGTRYDALRMLGVEPWEKRGAQLARYLSKATHAELQMGAVSGVADVQSPEAASALIGALPELTEGNRKLALDALLRDGERMKALLDAIEAGRVSAAVIGPERMARLQEHADAQIKGRAGQNER